MSKSAVRMSKSAADLSPYIKEIDEGFRKHVGRFKLNQPMSVTVKNVKGEYRKIPLIGGEEFTPASAYLGKKNDLILVFRPSFPSNYQYMEMKLSEAQDKMPGITRVVDGILQDKFDLSVSEINREVEEAARQDESSRAAENYVGNPAFASW